MGKAGDLRSLPANACVQMKMSVKMKPVLMSMLHSYDTCIFILYAAAYHYKPLKQGVPPTHT